MQYISFPVVVMGRCLRQMAEQSVKLFNSPVARKALQGKRIKIVVRRHKRR